ATPAAADAGMPVPTTLPQLTSGLPQPAAVPIGPSPPGVPAHGGLTAAQVRGTDGLAPAPATGWPNAAGMGRTG
ncbi:histidinol-phosphate aminotransferase family protein, partial [Streptomyces sp. TRM76130]|nr:histidinol-phosphate aminotransferase family protein [Streptomyces sp. TRM76130]